MANIHGTSLLDPVVAGDELMVRMLHDFDELPTLRLTTAQAMRLWDRDRPTCQKVLDSLVEAHLLRRDSRGQYCRPIR
jgi:DNA-binding IclR family transcriptional regulator